MCVFRGSYVRFVRSLTDNSVALAGEVLGSMSQSQELVPSGSAMTYNAVEDTSMAGSNGSPLVEYPEDRVGPTRDAPERLFYVYAPTIHWHTVSTAAEDEAARRVIEQLADEAYRFGQQTEAHEHRLLEGQQGLEEFVQQEQRAKDEELASVQGSLQKLTAEQAALGDAIQLLRVRTQQMDNFAQEAEKQNLYAHEQLKQRAESYQQVNRETNATTNRRIDLLDLRLQQVEEKTRTWSIMEQRLGLLQGEVTVMKETQTELLTTMKRLDGMMQKIAARMETVSRTERREGTMSPIVEEEPDQWESSADTREIHESADQQRAADSTGSWFTTPFSGPGVTQ